MAQSLSLVKSRAGFNAIVLYVLMIVGTVSAFLLIADLGSRLTAPAIAVAVAAQAAPGHQGGSLLHLLLALVVVIVACGISGRILRWLGQPPVIGEVIAGILLGPSLLGHVAPGVAEFLLPQSTTPFLGMTAQLGLVLYMFLVGLEFDAGALQRRGHAAIAISHASIIFPFVLGAALALGLYPIVSSDQVPFPVFALFLGVSMSITAFPVLARILTDRNMQSSPLGSMALACAATDDVTAWCLLALVTGVAQAQLGVALTVIGFTALYIAGMFFCVRPAVARLLPACDQEPPRAIVVAVLVGLLVSACITEWIGIHAVFGAFLVGAIIPHDHAVAKALRSKLADLVTIVLLPAFFAFAGMRTEIGLISGMESWLLCGLIILIATIGKFGGTAIAASLAGMPWRDSCALGVLMNTRGLMELIVLNIGLDMGFISPRLYALMVLMAVATTLMTTPALHALALAGKPKSQPLALPA
jgi:Kef-type K+ transport system membrane component KefB